MEQNGSDGRGQEQGSPKQDKHQSETLISPHQGWWSVWPHLPELANEEGICVCEKVEISFVYFLYKGR